MDLPMTNPIQALANAYAALNRHDVDGFAACFDPEIVRIEPPGFPSSGTYVRIAEVKSHVAQGRSAWAEGGCEPVWFVAAGSRVVVLVHVRVRLKGAADWIDGRIGDVFTFRGGKAVEFRTFGEVHEALEYAGIPPAPGTPV